MSSGNAQRGTRVTIMVIECLVGLAALIAGILFIVRPDGSLLGMSRGTLSATAFSGYLVPGILLTVVVAGLTLGGRVFWNVSDPANAIVVQLEREHHSRLVIDVADPDGTIATVRTAIARHALNAA